MPDTQKEAKINLLEEPLEVTPLKGNQVVLEETISLEKVRQMDDISRNLGIPLGLRHDVRWNVELNDIKLEYINTEKQLANISQSLYVRHSILGLKLSWECSILSRRCF